MTEKVLGKIEKVRYGAGGYDDAMFGLSVALSMNGGTTGTSDFKGWWTEYPERAKYTYDDWVKEHMKALFFVVDLMKKAKVNDVSKLVGIPVEVEIDGNMLKSWRVLEEVL